MLITDPSPLFQTSIGNPTLADDDAAATAAGGDFDTFLTLLTAQLRNQDPLSPMEGTEFVAQLASFSSVEQLVSVNERLDLLMQQSGAQGVVGIGDWIGRDVATSDGAFRADGNPVSFIVPKTDTSQTLEAIVLDGAGNELRRLAVFADENGQAQWDGLDRDGNRITETDLNIQLELIRDGIVTSTAPAEVLTRVTGVRGGPDGVTIDLADGRNIDPQLVSRLQEPVVQEEPS
ncbi:MAG: flagellar hook capping FlgD N-terminal domain-containing protein [Pseudomonadota bacterium]